MVDSPEDIIYNVKMLHRLQRYDDAITAVDSFFEVKNVLNKEERSYFFVVYKTAIDSSRYSYRAIDAYYQQNSQEGYTARAELLRKYKVLIAEKIVTIAQKAIDLINNHLLQSAEDASAQGFFYKMMGDMYRYISETNEGVEQSKSKNDGKMAYSKAIQICDENLSPVDPTRLGSILNASVFRYEQLNEKPEAIQMLQDAIQDIKNCSEEIDPNTQTEVQNAFDTMISNLHHWEHDGEEEDVE